LPRSTSNPCCALPSYTRAKGNQQKSDRWSRTRPAIVFALVAAGPERSRRAGSCLFPLWHSQSWLCSSEPPSPQRQPTNIGLKLMAPHPSHFCPCTASILPALCSCPRFCSMLSSRAKPRAVFLPLRFLQGAGRSRGISLRDQRPAGRYSRACSSGNCTAGILPALFFQRHRYDFPPLEVASIPR
jgi:hypothetical protein